MSISSNYSEEALVGRESLFRQKLSQLRTTGEIRRMAVSSKQTGFKELEQSFYLNNINSSWTHGDPRQLEKLALLDSLTELYNHDTINRMLKDEAKRAIRYRKNLSLLAITIDCLSPIAKLGNTAAYDSILKMTAQSLMQMIRDVDIPGRFDREHFLIICPETEESGAVTLANRLLHQINSQQNFDVNQNWDITISIGISNFPKPAENDKQMLALAFQALRVAEQFGGNTIRLAK